MRQSSERVRAEIPAIVEEATRKAEQRETDRFASEMRVRVEIDGRFHETDLVDVSREGARLGRVTGASEGGVVVVILEGRRHESRVIWTEGDHVGLRFASPIDAALLERVAAERISRGRRLVAAA